VRARFAKFLITHPAPPARYKGQVGCFKKSHLKSFDDSELHAHLEFEPIPNLNPGQSSSLIMSMRPMEDVEQRNIERPRAGYVDFIRTHGALPEDRRIADGISTLLNDVVFELFARSVAIVAAVESVLADSEKDATCFAPIRAIRVNRSD